MKSQEDNLQKQQRYLRFKLHRPKPSHDLLIWRLSQTVQRFQFCGIVLNEQSFHESIVV